MGSAEPALVLITMTLFFSLLVERITELAMALLDYGDVRFHWHRFWQQRAAKLAWQLSQPRDPRWQQELVRALERYLSCEANGVTAVSVAKVRQAYLQLATKLVAITVGIVLAWLLELNVFAAIDQLNAAAGEQSMRYFSSAFLPQPLALVLTGIVLGLGAGPLHKVISALERARKDKQPPEAKP